MKIMKYIKLLSFMEMHSRTHLGCEMDYYSVELCRLFTHSSGWLVCLVLGSIQDLVLALCLGLIPGSTQGTIYNNGN